jgi:hypothetical protein
MFKPIFSKPIVRMIAAASVATALAFALMASPGANPVGSELQKATAQPDASADTGRLRVPTRGNACSVHGWPNFEPKCQFDLREPAAEARTIRVIALR